MLQHRHLLVVLGVLILAAMACGPAATATPTQGSSSPTPASTLFVPPTLTILTPTATGAVGVPTPTATTIPAGERPKNGGIVQVSWGKGTNGANNHDPTASGGFGWPTL